MDRNQEIELPSLPSVHPGMTVRASRAAPASRSMVVPSLPRRTQAATTEMPTKRIASCPEYGTGQKW